MDVSLASRNLLIQFSDNSLDHLYGLGSSQHDEGVGPLVGDELELFRGADLYRFDLRSGCGCSRGGLSGVKEGLELLGHHLGRGIVKGDYCQLKRISGDIHLFEYLQQAVDIG